jgi:hypothetical protein
MTHEAFNPATARRLPKATQGRMNPRRARSPQPRSGNPQLPGNLAQRPAAAYQKPQSLPLEFIRILTTRCAHQTPFCSFASLSEVSTISEEA